MPDRLTSVWLVLVVRRCSFTAHCCFLIISSLTQEEKRKLEDELEACDTSEENIKDDDDDNNNEAETGQDSTLNKPEQVNVQNEEEFEVKDEDDDDNNANPVPIIVEQSLKVRLLLSNTELKFTTSCVFYYVILPNSISIRVFVCKFLNRHRRDT